MGPQLSVYDQGTTSIVKLSKTGEYEVHDSILGEPSRRCFYMARYAESPYIAVISSPSPGSVCTKHEVKFTYKKGDSPSDGVWYDAQGKE